MFLEVLSNTIYLKEKKRLDNAASKGEYNILYTGDET